MGHKTNPELWRKLRNAGATSIDLEGTPTVAFPEGRIELVEARPIPRLGDGVAVLESGPARVLTNAQILAGKLIHRGTKAPVRDLYDLAVGRTEDPKAVTLAVNATDSGWLVAARTYWHNRQERYAQEGGRQIHGVPGRYREVQADPAAHAETAVTDTMYSRMVVEVVRGSVRVTTENRRGAEERQYERIADMRRGFEEDGINGALAARGYNAGRIRNRCGNALTSGKDEVVLKTGARLPGEPKTPGDPPAPAEGSGNQGRNKNGYTPPR